MPKQYHRVRHFVRGPLPDSYPKAVRIQASGSESAALKYLRQVDPDDTLPEDAMVFVDGVVSRYTVSFLRAMRDVRRKRGAAHA